MISDGRISHHIASHHLIPSPSLKSCSKVMLEEPRRRHYLKRLRSPHLDNIQRRAATKGVNDECKKVVYCPYCGETNGVVKKVGALKILHEKFRHKRTHNEASQHRAALAAEVNLQAPEMRPFLSRAQDDLNPLRVQKLFEQISDEDVELLGLDPMSGRPELLLWSSVPVPPICIRPSVAQDGASTEDDLTVKLTEIIFTNALIKAGLDKGGSVQNLMEQWEFLQLSVAMYIHSELPGVPSSVVVRT